MKWVKRILIAIVIITIIVLVINYYLCWSKGKKSKKAYECSCFKSEPEFVKPEEIRYRIRQGKCYEITDYGKKMSFRQVGLSECGKDTMDEEAIIEEEIIGQ